MTNLWYTAFPYTWLDDVLTDVMQTGRGTFANASTSHPRYETWIEDDTHCIEMLLAGYPKEVLSVNVKDNELTIQADKGSTSAPKHAARAFKKSFLDIYDQWDWDSSDISYENGVLFIKTPIRKEKKGRQLTIK